MHPCLISWFVFLFYYWTCCFYNITIHDVIPPKYLSRIYQHSGLFIFTLFGKCLHMFDIIIKHNLTHVYLLHFSDQKTTYLYLTFFNNVMEYKENVVDYVKVWYIYANLFEYFRVRMKEILSYPSWHSNLVDPALAAIQQSVSLLHLHLPKWNLLNWTFLNCKLHTIKVLTSQVVDMPIFLKKIALGEQYKNIGSL